MTWREKSVTVDDDSEYIFKSVLGDVTIDRKGLHREELTGSRDWKTIRETIGDDDIFEGFLQWDDVKAVSKKDNFLSYPHIDIEVDEETDREWDASKLMIFFKEDTPDNFDEIDRCFKAIKKMWDAHRQRNKLNSLDYSYQEETHRIAPPETLGGPDDEDEGEDDEGGDDEDESTAEDDEDGEETDGADDGDDGGGLENVIEKATQKPGELMDEFGS